ncbi:MAG: malto-oligosyltrehalose trehalohydrolase [Nocardioidaceae bacterium]|nr:malto-oligosyltrehalose trehalohydrolase [Nocardioidaceae bacterium]
MKFEVWAPNATERVDLVLDNQRHAMAGAESGWWRIEVDAEPDSSYMFAIDGRDLRPDPRALRLPDGPEGPSQLFDLAAVPWTDTQWRGAQLPGAVIYEMHVGTFTPEGTLDAAIERLDHLVGLGVDMVEVMPLASFPGRHGWGYDGVGLYAVHEPYGGPAAFCRFVDACHARGLGVFLDVVYNHLGPSGNHLQEFGPYFTDRYDTPWGQALNLDGPDSDDVRRFMIDNALMWLRDFHVDGLRLDAVHALFDVRAVTLLEELSAEVSALSTRLGRPLWLVAESDRNDPLTVTPREAGGLGLHATWADDVHHGLHVLLTGETQGYYADFAAPGSLEKVLGGMFLHAGTYSTFRRRTHGRPLDRTRTSGWRFVVSLQTHDQVGNRAIGDRLSAQLTPGSLACGAALLLTSAGTPMLFMGEEWGASTPWQYFTDHTDSAIATAVRRGRRDDFASHGWSRNQVPDPQAEGTAERSQLDWSEVALEPQARILRWYADLIRLRRERPDLGDPRLDRVSVDHDLEGRTVVVYRGDHFVVVNLSGDERLVKLDVDDTVELETILAWEPAATSVEGATVHLPPESAAIFALRT